MSSATPSSTLPARAKKRMRTKKVPHILFKCGKSGGLEMFIWIPSAVKTCLYAAEKNNGKYASVGEQTEKKAVLQTLV